MQKGSGKWMPDAAFFAFLLFSSGLHILGYLTPYARLSEQSFTLAI